MKLVKIIWKDIIRPEETWLFKEDVLSLRPALITTVGWLVDENESSLIIASSLGDDQQFGDINCIPTSVVVLIETLRGEIYEDQVDIPIV